jgi:hypothetical protein
MALLDEVAIRSLISLFSTTTHFLLTTQLIITLRGKEL